MTSSFASLKKNRNKAFEKLTEQLQKIGNKGYTNPEADKYWKPTRDQAGNAFAIIRFLPEPDGEDFPFVRLWDHAFQGPTGQWYIENSRKTISMDEPDPVAELNAKLWNSTTDDESPQRKQVRKQKRRLHYISNIYVIKDTGNPENEGKVFLFKYGKKVYDKLNELMNPSFEDEEKVNPFDLWEGANFRLKIRVVDGYPNYDKSEFDSPGALFEDDDRMEAIWKQCHPLKDVIAPHNFKPYDELQARLHRVLGVSSDAGASQSAPATTFEDDVDDEIDMSKLSKPQMKSAPAPKIKEDEGPSITSSGEDDDDLEYFKTLAART
jgi:hypothetical protein